MSAVIEDNVEGWEHRLRCTLCDETLYGFTDTGILIMSEPPHVCKEKTT